MKVLVTGAGGSIGSVLARQVAARGDEVIVVDRAEGPLYEIARELRVPEYLADVSSVVSMRRIMAETRPDLVLHAAAYKHVPMMERHPADAVISNVGGTLATMRAALEYGVSRFVLISTDKAVHPVSVMGATKRLAEQVVATAGPPYVSVRFGNVLGTSGSVIPLWKSQIAAGEPMTITDPAMTRYFISVEEAVSRVLAVAEMARPHDLYVLDMGKPVWITDLARQVARETGNPGWPVEFVGLRPGEKLHESLSYEHEALQPTSHPKISRIAQGPTDLDVDGLLTVALTGDHEWTREALWALLEPAVAA